MPLPLQWIKKTMENVSFSIVFLAHPTGIEPVTARIGIWCAIQLRHGCIYKIYDYSICFPAPNQALFHFSPKRAKQNLSNSPQLCDGTTVHLMLVVCLFKYITDVIQCDCFFICIYFSSTVAQ